MLDPTQIRILGVLAEKALAVPETYPLTENSLLAGCNQKSNRDPEMGLEVFEVRGALMKLIEDEWVTATTMEGSRAERYRHRLKEQLDLDDRQLAVMVELMVRGPQAPGALKARVARMGFHGSPAEVQAVLESLRARLPKALVQQLPHRPRERDQRWGHLLGDEADQVAVVQEAMPSPAHSTPTPAAKPLPHLQPAPVAEVSAAQEPDLQERVTALEEQVQELQVELQRLRRDLGA